jgi:hypothetical protein
VVAVESTVSVEVTAAVPVTSGEVGLRLQVAGLVAPLGPVTAQVRFTVPVNPPDGVTEMTEVLFVVAPGTRLRAVGAAVRAKLGVPLTAASMARV